MQVSLLMSYRLTELIPGNYYKTLFCYVNVDLSSCALRKLGEETR
jgi:hypothetical protein